MTLSTISSLPMEEVASAAPDAPRWFQLYAPEDRGACRELIERAVAAAYGAIAITVDLPVPGNRERDIRNRFEVILGAHLPPSEPTGESGLVLLPTMDWDELDYVRSICPIRSSSSRPPRTSSRTRMPNGRPLAGQRRREPS